MTRATALPIAFLLIAVVACSSDTRKAEDTLALAADTPALIVPPPPVATASSGGMLDPNSASRAELAAVPGLSDGVAGAIIAARPVATMVAVDKVLPANLTEQQRDTVYARLWKPIDLNTATDAEILLIPGVGNRMLREFKEYRPYTSIGQFRREIGKYVDKTELARLEMYVAAP
jgi:DNA uptake protein ComE-like DNA-binding protein